MQMNAPKIRLWYARGVLGLAALLFAFLAQLYVFTPLDGIDMFGVTVSGEAHSITFIRTGVGAMFAGLLITSVVGLARPQLFHMCISIIVIAMTLIVTIRLYGLSVDGITEKNLSELRTESASWLIFVSGWLSYPKQTKPTD